MIICDNVLTALPTLPERSIQMCATSPPYWGLRTGQLPCYGRSMDRKSNGQFAKGSHWRPHQRFRDVDYLAEEYGAKNRSANDIANEWGVTENAILYWLGKHQLRRRSMTETRSVKKWSSPGESNGMFGRIGPANPRYVSGSSPERQRIYASSFWKVLFQQVLHRDGFKCVKCGCAQSKKNPLHGHHLLSWASYEEHRFDLDNIITLCKKCHNWVHSKVNICGEFLKTKDPPCL